MNRDGLSALARGAMAVLVGAAILYAIVRELVRDGTGWVRA